MVWIDLRRAFDFKVWRSYANLAKLNLWLNCIYDIQQFLVIKFFTLLPQLCINILSVKTDIRFDVLPTSDYFG